MKKLFVIFLFLFNTAFAQDSSNTGDPGLSELIRSASVNNSKLKPLEYENLIRLSQIDQFNKQPAPSVELMEDFIPSNFKNPGELSLIFSQQLRLFGKLNASAEYNYHRSMIPEIQLDELKKDLIKEIKANYFLLYQNERKVKINELDEEIIKGITKAIEIQYSVGKSSQTDILKSNSELQKLMYEEIDFKTERKELINNLETLTGIKLTENYRTKDVDIYFSSGPVYSDSIRLVKLLKLNNPEFKMLDHDRLLNDLEKNIAELERKPDLTIKSGYRYKTDMKESFFLISAMVDLPFLPWNSERIDAKVKEKELTDQQISSKYNTALEYLRTEIRNNVNKIEGQNEKIKFIKEITIPQLEQTLKSSLVGYQAGNMDIMSVIDTYRMLKENDFKLIAEETMYLLYLNQLERTVAHELVKLNDQ
ncbi:TolC family protein [soil metagenome]